MRRISNMPPILIVCTTLAICFTATRPARGDVLIKELVRVKGQEENTLRGLGLVVGLNGTGDSGEYLPMARSLAMSFLLMGSEIAPGVEKGAKSLELKNTKNVALVWVTATVPGAGARQGDKIDCTVVSCGNAKSLKGGHLFAAAMQGPNPESQRVYAFAQGNVSLEDPKLPLSGKITSGCRLEEDFFSDFTKDGKIITLVLDEHKRDFQVAQNIASLINSAVKSGGSDNITARAIDATNIEVTIPQQYREDPVEFIALVLGQRIFDEDLRTEARVVINKKKGTVIISGDVVIGAVIISHKNIQIDTGGTAERNLAVDGAGNRSKRFLSLDPNDNFHANKPPDGATTQQIQSVKLRSLVEALNAIQVPTSDVIAIIEELHKTSKLHAKLIVH